MGHELDLLRNYLSESKQYVVIDGCLSSPRTVTAGVPQGSILGLVYVSPFYQRPTLSSSAFYR